MSGARTTVDLPSPEVLAAHGLLDFEIDAPPSPDRLGLITGTARFHPVERYPALVSVDNDERVKVRWVSKGEQGRLKSFVREAQIIWIDCNPRPDTYSATLASSNTAGPSHTSSDKAINETSIRRGLKPLDRAGVDTEVLGWWDDRSGVWLITRVENAADLVPLVQYWETVFGSRGAAAASPSSIITDESTISRCCILLAQVALCMKSLHDKGLSILATRPHDFCVRRATPHHVVNLHLANVHSLPGFRFSALVSGITPQLALWFQLDEISAVKPELKFLVDNAQVLSPEVILKRTALSSNDIYSFGIIVFELLTGVTFTESGGSDAEEVSSIGNSSDSSTPYLRSRSGRRTPLAITSTNGDFSEALQRLEMCLARCLAPNVTNRYKSFDAILHDLSEIIASCRSNRWSDWSIGAADVRSRFTFPSSPISLDEQLGTIKLEFSRLGETNGLCRNVNLWGPSGVGKTMLVSEWLSQLHDVGRLERVITAHIQGQRRGTQSSFHQLFQSLMTSVLAAQSDVSESFSDHIKHTLGGSLPAFLSFLTAEQALVLAPIAPTTSTFNLVMFTTAFRQWCIDLLQILATKDRPLVIVVDDLQWMPSDERQVWEALFGDPESLRFTFLLTICRIASGEDDIAIPQLTAFGESVEVPPLSAAGVQAFIVACVDVPVAQLSVLTNLLWTETGGVALHLRFLLQTMASRPSLGVNDKRLSFNFAKLMWEFDLFALQKGLTASGMDAYLEWIQMALPSEEQECIHVLSLLPAMSTPIMLAEFLRKPVEDVRVLMSAVGATGLIRERRNGRYVFSHDRQKVIAHRLIPEDRRALLHLEVSQFLRRPGFKDEFRYESAHLALRARLLGAPAEDPTDLVVLLSSAVAVELSSAMFETAKEMLDTIDGWFEAHSIADDIFDIIQRSGGCKVWLVTYPSLYLDYLDKHTDLCGFLSDFDGSARKLSEALSFAQSATDKLRIITADIRRMINSNQMDEALALFFTTMAQYGYDPERPVAVRVWDLEDVEDVHSFQEQLLSIPLAPAQGKVAEQIVKMICAISIIIFSAQHPKALAVFRVGVSIIARLENPVPASSYCRALYAALSSNVGSLSTIEDLVRQIGTTWPTTTWSMVSLAALASNVVHLTHSLVQVAEEMRSMYNGCISVGDHSVAAYTHTLEMLARHLSNGTPLLEVASMRFRVIDPFVAPYQRMFIKLPVQYSYRVSQMAMDAEPWSMNGFITVDDLKAVSQLGLHMGIYFLYKLRLAIMYDADLRVQNEVIKEGEKHFVLLKGCIGGPEWSFLTVLVGLRSGRTRVDLEEEFRNLAIASESPDDKLRLRMLETLVGIEGLEFGAADGLIDELDKQEFYTFSGILNFDLARRVLDITGNEILARGYIHSTFDAFDRCEHFGLCQMLARRFPKAGLPATEGRNLQFDLPQAMP